MTAPVGVRRVRGQAGWRLLAGAVIVDRTSRRGNPFTVRAIVAEHQALGVSLTAVDAAAIACRRYAAWLDVAGHEVVGDVVVLDQVTVFARAALGADVLRRGWRSGRCSIAAGRCG